MPCAKHNQLFAPAGVCALVAEGPRKYHEVAGLANVGLLLWRLVAVLPADGCGKKPVGTGSCKKLVDDRGNKPNRVPGELHQGLAYDVRAQHENYPCSI